MWWLIIGGIIVVLLIISSCSNNATEDKLSPPQISTSTTLDKLREVLKEHDYTKSISLYRKLVQGGHDQKMLDQFITDVKKENPPHRKKERKNRNT